MEMCDVLGPDPPSGNLDLLGGGSTPPSSYADLLGGGSGVFLSGPPPPGSEVRVPHAVLAEISHMSHLGPERPCWPCPRTWWGGGVCRADYGT